MSRRSPAGGLAGFFFWRRQSCFSCGSRASGSSALVFALPGLGVPWSSPAVTGVRRAAGGARGAAVGGSRPEGGRRPGNAHGARRAERTVNPAALLRPCVNYAPERLASTAAARERPQAALGQPRGPLAGGAGALTRGPGWWGDFDIAAGGRTARLGGPNRRLRPEGYTPVQGEGMFAALGGWPLDGGRMFIRAGGTPPVAAPPHNAAARPPASFPPLFIPHPHCRPARGPRYSGVGRNRGRADGGERRGGGTAAGPRPLVRWGRLGGGFRQRYQAAVRAGMVGSWELLPGLGAAAA